MQPLPANVLIASRMLTEPDPSSVRPGAGTRGKKKFAESRWAPMMVRGSEALRTAQSGR